LGNLDDLRSYNLVFRLFETDSFAPDELVGEQAFYLCTSEKVNEKLHEPNWKKIINRKTGAGLEVGIRFRDERSNDPTDYEMAKPEDFKSFELDK